MTFPSHSTYKDSGADWLGDVPAHWDTMRVRRIFSIIKRIAGREGYDVLSVTQQGLRVKDLDANTGQFASDYSGYQIVEPGDFVMNHMDLLTGYADVSSVLGVTSPDYRVFRFRVPKGRDPNYFRHVFQNCYHRRILYAFGQGASHFGRWRLPTDEFNDFIVPVPPLPEQRAIAAFLDRETGKIDALVEEQRQLIALLNEKRQAVISHAVTKGLNPDAPMKPSGIEWLGDVPEHWEVGKLGYFAKLQGGYAFPSDAFGTDGVPVVRMNNLDRGRLNLSEAARIPETSCNERVSLSEGDLLWGMSGSVGETGSLGNFGRVSEDDLPCQLNQRVGRFLPTGGRTDLDFLTLVIQARYFYEQVLLWVTGTAQFNISSQQVESCIVAVPPLDEQVAIISFVARDLEALDTLALEAETAITLLQERRSALISAAVTGKIDVRGLASAETEAA